MTEPVAEPEQAPSPPTPPEKTPADDELEQEEAQEAVASEKDEPETGVQTRRGPSFARGRIDSHTGMLNQCSRFTGKRKAEAEADPKREKKKSREVSEPLEESEPEPGKDVPALSDTLSAPYLP